MAAKQKTDLEITLARVQMPSLNRTGSHQHVVTVELIYPRLGVASKSSAKTIVLKNGICEADLLPWTRKICFKESVEGSFGVHVTISERLSATQMRKMMRFIAGKSLDIGADAVEDAIPMPVVDEIAVQPLIYLSKQLLTTTQAKIIAEGYLDLKAGLFSDTPSLISVPLLSCRKIALNGKQILKENAPDGSVELSAVAI